MFNVEEIHTLITSLILGIFIGILLGCLKCFGVETPNPYKSMGNSTSQEIKIKNKCSMLAYQVVKIEQNVIEFIMEIDFVNFIIYNKLFS